MRGTINLYRFRQDFQLSKGYLAFQNPISTSLTPLEVDFMKSGIPFLFGFDTLEKLNCIPRMSEMTYVTLFLNGNYYLLDNGSMHTSNWINITWTSAKANWVKFTEFIIIRLLRSYWIFWKELDQKNVAITKQIRDRIFQNWNMSKSLSTRLRLKVSMKDTNQIVFGRALFLDSFFLNINPLRHAIDTLTYFSRALFSFVYMWTLDATRVSKICVIPISQHDIWNTIDIQIIFVQMLAQCSLLRDRKIFWINVMPNLWSLEQKPITLLGIGGRLHASLSCTCRKLQST